MSKEATELKENMNQAIESASKNSNFSPNQKSALEKESKDLQGKINDMPGQDQKSQETTMEKLKEWMLKIKNFITSSEFSQLVNSAINFVQTVVQNSSKIIESFAGLKEKGITGIAEGIQSVTTGVQDITKGLSNVIAAGEAAKDLLSSPEDKIKKMLGTGGLAELQAASAGLQSNASIASSSASISTPTAARSATQQKDSIAR